MGELSTSRLLMLLVFAACFIAGVPIVVAFIVRLVPLLLELALIVGIIGLALGAWHRRY